MNATRIRESPPTLWCRETSRVIQELFWGGWACYKATFTGEPNYGKGRVEGEHVGVAECYSHAHQWLFGDDTDAATGCRILLTVVDDLSPPTPGEKP